MCEGVAILLRVIFLGTLRDTLGDRLSYFGNLLLLELIIELGRVLLLLFFFLLFLLIILLLLGLAVVFDQKIVVLLAPYLKVDFLILKEIVEILDVLSHKGLDDFELVFLLNCHADGLLLTEIGTLIVDVHFVKRFLE